MKKDKTKHNIKKELIVSTLLVIAMFWLGTSLGLFKGLTWYDEIVHFIAGAWGGIIIFWIYTQYTHIIPFYEKFRKSPIVFITLIMIIIGIGWEFFEFGLVKYLEFAYNASVELQPSQFDTLTDLLLDGFGAGIASYKLLNPYEVDDQTLL